MASRTPPTRRATTTATATMSTSRDCPGLSLTGSPASPISPIDLIASDVSLAGEAPKPTKEGRSGREHDALRLCLGAEAPSVDRWIQAKLDLRNGSGNPTSQRLRGQRSAE